MLRTPFLALLLLVTSLSSLSAVTSIELPLGTQLYWHPQGASTNGHAVVNWSLNDATYTPPTSTTINGAVLNFNGLSSNNAGCTFVTDIAIHGINTTGHTQLFQQTSGVITLDTNAVFAGNSHTFNGTLISVGNGATLAFNSGESLPALTIQNSATLTKTTGGNEDPHQLFAGQALTLSTNATLTLAHPLILNDGATLVQANGATIAGLQPLIWQQNADFPAPGGLAITAPIIIDQVDTDTETVINLPGVWTFGSSLTFRTVNTLGSNPELDVTITGPISADGGVFFQARSGNATIRVSFNGTLPALGTSGTMMTIGSDLDLIFRTLGAPISLSSSTVDFSETSGSVTFDFDPAVSIANVAVQRIITTGATCTAAGPVGLQLNGSGDSTSTVTLSLDDAITWVVLKSGSATTVAIAPGSQPTVQQWTNETAVATRVSGEDPLRFTSNASVDVSLSGGSNGTVEFAAPIDLPSGGLLVLSNSADSAATIRVSGDIRGATTASTLRIGNDSRVEITGTDERIFSDGEGISRIEISSGAVLDHRGSAGQIPIRNLAPAVNAELRGTVSAGRYEVGSGTLSAIMRPGGFDFDYGVMSFTTADFSIPTTEAFLDIIIKVGGNESAGFDYDSIASDALIFGATNTTLTFDLSQWPGGNGTVSGVFTASSSVSGDPTVLPLSLTSGADISVELVPGAPGRFDLIITDASVNPPPPVAGVFRAPTLPVSSRRSTLWTAVAPGTPEGLDHLRAKLAGRSRDEVRAFAWDPTTQAYVEFPDEPQGGAQPWHGWFIATTVPMSLNFRGTFASAPYRVPLQPGWNLVGYGPISDTVNLTAFPLAELELRDGSDATLTGAARSAVIGANLIWWNVRRYHNLSSFASGRAYWVYNADPDSHELVYTGNNELVNEVEPLNMVANSASPASAVTPTPPAPPTLGEAEADESGSCGGGSAFGFLILLIALSGLRWQRVIRL